MLTTALIVIPVAGALLVAIAPLSSYWLGSLAALISLVEVAVWITTAGRFDFSSSTLQFDQRASWFSDLQVSWHVGQYRFSLWFVGMTVVVMAACTIYGWWVGRDRARAYFALMLVLGSVSLVCGSLLAFRAPDFRGVVMYSSLAQAGLIVLGLFA